MSPRPRFHVHTGNDPTPQALIRGLSRAVFVQEQGLDPTWERDGLDSSSQHVVALADDHTVIGTARLTAERQIEWLVVHPQWRGQGIGALLVQTLLDAGSERDWNEIGVLACAGVRDFFAQQGFLPAGTASEGNLQRMRRRIGGAVRVEDLVAATAIAASIVRRARRQLLIHSPVLEPGLWDSPLVVRNLRRFVTARHDKQVQILLHDQAAVRQATLPLLTLSQRLPSAFQFREPVDPVDRGVTCAYVVNDRGDYYFRPIARHFFGEAAFDQSARARQLHDSFSRIFKHSRECVELRALGI